GPGDASRAAGEADARLGTIEAELRERAQRSPDLAVKKKVARAFERRDERQRRLSELEAAPIPFVRFHSPVVAAVERVRALVEAQGGRLVVVALPTAALLFPSDRAASPGIEPARLLLGDLIEAAQDTGVAALDASAALREVGPDAFLADGVHLGPKGHAAVGRVLGAAIREPPPAPTRLGAGLPPGRSRLPQEDEWKSAGSFSIEGAPAAGCLARRVREWLQVRCERPQPGAPEPIGVVMVQGGRGEAMTMRWDGVLTLIAPVLRGDELRAVFSWERRTRELGVDWPAERADGEFALREAGAAPQALAPGEPRLCACHREKRRSPDCRDLLGVSDADCARFYAGDCAGYLACATGHPLFPPRCSAGWTNAGAAQRCWQRCRADEDCQRGRCREQQGAKLCVPP
ncbi:MAG: hypothetical protein HY744_02635, partial [Deltaproteobacteria bacterium]|nr:hypothetical protein [Deltaproteobacteria bacterium]